MLETLGANTCTNIIFNVSCNPYPNPIESVFALIKSAFRRNTMNIQNIKPGHLIQAIYTVGNEVIKKTIRRVLRNIS